MTTSRRRGSPGDRTPATDRRARLARDLWARLDRPVTVETLDTWVGTSAERGAFLSDTLWGSIRWPKSLGKPLGGTLAGGFVIEHSYLLDLWTVQDGEVVDHYSTVPLPAPLTWDGPDDTAYHRVSFFTHYAPISKYVVNDTILAQFSAARWSPASRVLGPGYRYLEPTGFDFTPTEGRRVVLEPIEVKWRGVKPDQIWHR